MHKHASCMPAAPQLHLNLTDCHVPEPGYVPKMLHQHMHILQRQGCMAPLHGRCSSVRGIFASGQFSRATPRHVQVAASWQPAEFGSLAMQALQDGSDRATLERIAHVRNLVIG